MAQHLPYSDSTFDVVTSSLFFHHLTLEDKSRALQCLDGFETTREHVKGRLSTLVRKAGFHNVVITKNTGTPLGTISLLRASK